MLPKELVNMFNYAPTGSYIKKDVLKEIAEKQYLLLIEPQGLIWPKRMSEGKTFSYTITLRQLIIRNKEGIVASKIMLGNIENMDLRKEINTTPVIRLFIKNS